MTRAQEVAGIDRFIARWSRGYWTLGAYVWSALYVVAYFADTEPTTRNHVFLVAILHWATRDILAALCTRHEGKCDAVAAHDAAEDGGGIR